MRILIVGSLGGQLHTATKIALDRGAKVSQVVVTRLNGIRQSQSRNSSQCRPCSVHD